MLGADAEEASAVRSDQRLAFKHEVGLVQKYSFYLQFEMLCIESVLPQ